MSSNPPIEIAPNHCFQAMMKVPCCQRCLKESDPIFLFCFLSAACLFALYRLGKDVCTGAEQN